MSGGDGFVGANPAQLDELAAAFDASADLLDQMLAEVRSLTDAAPWSGTDADEFRDAVRGDVASRVGRTAATLRDEATELRRQAVEQHTASAAPGGSAGFGAPGNPATAGAGSAGFWGLPVLVPGGLAMAGSAGAPPAWADPWSRSTAGEVFRGAEWHGRRDGDSGGVTYGGQADARAGAGADGSAHAGWQNGSIGAGAEGRAWAGAELSAAGSATYGIVKAQAAASGFVGVEAAGKLDAHVGLDGAHADAGADAFVGGKAGAEGSLDVGGAEAGAGGHVSYGVGATAHAGGSITTEKIAVHAELGFAFGLGADVHVDLEVHPAEIVQNIRGGAEDFFHVVNPFD